MSGGSAYRSDARRERLEALERRARELEAGVNEDFWRFAAPKLGLAPPEKKPSSEERTLRKRLDELGDPTALDALLALREARVAALERAHAQLDDAERAFQHAPNVIPALSPDVAVLWNSDLQHGGASLRTLLAHALDEVLGPTRLGREFLAPGELRTGVFDGAPVGAALELNLLQRNNENGWRLLFVTSVAPGSRAYRLDPMGMGHDLLKAVRLVRDVEFDDSAFDEAFLVRGDVPTLRAALSPEARAALMALARDDVPRVTCDGVHAALRFSFEPSAARVTHALRALAALHHARAPYGLRREGPSP